MNPCQYELLKTILRQFRDLFKDLFPAAASALSSCIRDQAIGTIHLAPVLHFEKCSCMHGRPVQHPDQVVLVLIADGDVTDPAFHQVVFCRVHITPHRHNLCRRVQFSRPSEHLSRFFVCDVGDRAGVYNIDICGFRKGHDPVAVCDQEFPQSLSFICVYLASEIVECCGLFAPAFF